MKRLLRVVWVGIALHFKMLSRSQFDMFVVIASPLIFATLAYFLFGGKNTQELLVAAIASGVMGIWSMTTAQGAGALQRQRSLGILELLVASPTPFWAIVLPITIAISALGIYSLVIGLAYVRLFYGVTITISNWWAFALAVPATIGSIGALGFVFTSVLVRFRSAFMIGNVFEWPVWTICGLLIPVSLLPAWLQPVSWILAPTWGMAALRAATLGHGAVWADIGMCAVLAVAYLVIGSFFVRRVVDAARARATLALA